MKILLIFDLILLSVHYLKCLYFLLNIYQQNHYDKKKYLASMKNFYLCKKYNYFYYAIILFMVLGMVFDQVLMYYICYTIALVLLLTSFCFYDHFVIPLKFTPRLIRLSVTTLVLSILLILPFCFVKEIYLISLFGILLPFVLILASFFNQPLENYIKCSFKKRAMTKLSSFPHIIKIGITGSFGKTSTKNILYSVLSSKYHVLKTPKSYNTMMGISKTINQELKENHEIFIVEMGAFRKGEIEEMTLAIEPDIAIITEVGPQHLSTFHTIDHIVEAKFEITKGKGKDVILNFDNERIKNYEKAFDKEITSFGIRSGIYTAKNITYQNNVTFFDIYENDTYKLSIQTNLLAKHNIANIICAYATIQTLSKYNIIIDDKTFQAEIEKLKPSMHRLSYKYVQPFHIYDDSYSSNLVGFKNALEVLKNQTGIKCIITPGIVDGGQKEEELNKEVASHLENGIDEIYLIKNKASQTIIKFLEEKKIPCKVFTKFMDAYLDLTKKYQYSLEDVHILIENDLPDSFLER